jgi:YVTN family beta-propeller protein
LSITRWMNVFTLAAVLAGCAKEQQQQHPRPAPDAPAAAEREPDPGSVLVTGRSIDPESAVAAQEVGSLPVNMVVAPGGRFAVTTGQGSRQLLWSVRTEDGKGVGRVNFPRNATRPTNGLYYGLAFAPDGTLYAAQGNADSIAVLRLAEDGSLELQRDRIIRTRRADFPSGLALDNAGRLYVANNDPISTGAMTGKPRASVAVYDAAAGKELWRFVFESDLPGSNFPLALAVLADGSKLYVASQRDGAVYVLDTSSPQEPKLRTKLETGSHPVATCLNKDGSRLYVANAHSDTVSVVDTAADRVTATVLLRPAVVKHLAGATPTGLALSPDEKTLYATLGDMNAVAVIDVDDSPPELRGYLPVGWYPSAVVVAPDGKHLLVANAKGAVTRHPNPPDAAPDKKRHVSPLALLEGTVAVVPLPDKEGLSAASQRVLELNRLSPRHVRHITENPLKSIGLQAGGIKHVIYIVKENRTYDQVLGDLPQGNGDPNRCLFGRAVTPNQHSLAERFVLMDNFYDCGEVSGDGWTWSTQAQANEYVIRNVPYSYSDRGRTFDYEGQINHYPSGGFPATGADGKPLSDHPDFRGGAKAVPDVAAAPGGHLWDLARKANLPFRNYGFFMSNLVKSAEGVTVIPDNYPNDAGLQPGGHDLEGFTDVDFRRFDLDYADSDARWNLYRQTNNESYLMARRTFGKDEAHSRFEEWNREFQMMLKKDATGGAVPNLMLVRFGDDHTVGLNPAKHTPRSMVADNDYAVGQLVEAVSKSPIWKSCAIFIIEDDAQNGPDHVDAHRSTCYVISPWIKKGSIDHSFHNTVSVLKTMELLLGLPPMCQYDAAAAPIMDWDTTPSNAEPYAAVMPNRSILIERNGDLNPAAPVSPEARAELEEMARESAAMNFEVADKAPADRLNEIIWASVKGPGSAQPPTPRGPQGVWMRQGAAEEGNKDDDD